MARSDEELLEAARAGDDEALEALLARHEHKVFRFGLRMCGNEEDARDVLQDTLLAAFKGVRQFRGRRPAFDLAVPGGTQLLHARRAGAASVSPPGTSPSRERPRER